MGNPLRALIFGFVLLFSTYNSSLADQKPALSSTPVPNIDWQPIDDGLMNPGDHVVGEELCAKSGNERLEI